MSVRICGVDQEWVIETRAEPAAGSRASTPKFTKYNFSLQTSFDLAIVRVGTTLCYSSLKVTKLDGFMRQNETPSPTVHSAAFQRVRMGKSLSISLIIKTELQSVALQRTEGFLKLYINQTQLNAGVESLNLSVYFFSFLR